MGKYVVNRRDANEPQIRAALEQVGAQTFPLGGKNCPDLLVWFRGREYVMEIKSARGKNRKDEAHDGIPWPVISTVGEALAYVGVLPRRKRSEDPLPVAAVREDSR